MGKDPVKVMMEDLEILTSEGNKYTNEEREQAIENLQMHCEDLDLAQGEIYRCDSNMGETSDSCSNITVVYVHQNDTSSLRFTSV